MVEIEEGLLVFRFDTALAGKYDDWSFYRNQFNSAFGGTKAVDMICLDSTAVWLIEVKDYRGHTRTKPTDLGDEVAAKVRDTLAGLLAARFNANDSEEKKLAKAVAQRKELRVVLHLEQPAKHSKLRRRAIEPADVQQKLRQLLKAVDPHPRVVERATTRAEMPWMVEDKS
ncbi:hypothetical protein [Chitinimonas lacunae]|uniref:Cysteinyl-tRNA synthetase n=1 Tax=Chitinimonas lacunae TaxID=1963018 RepID=A0ABV8MSA9_9NEIS